MFLLLKKTFFVKWNKIKKIKSQYNIPVNIVLNVTAEDTIIQFVLKQRKTLIRRTCLKTKIF
jgi:hypothetical protein